MQRTFQILPTDPRFQELTEEQLDLMYQHYLIDSKPSKRRNAGYDPDYDKEESKLERYEDPDFDAAWDATDEEDNSDIVPQNVPEVLPEGFIGADSDEWKEV